MQKHIVNSGRKKYFQYMYTSTSLDLEVDELATSYLVLVSYTGLHLYLRKLQVFRKLFPQVIEFWILFLLVGTLGNYVKRVNFT